MVVEEDADNDEDISEMPQARTTASADIQEPVVIPNECVRELYPGTKCSVPAAWVCQDDQRESDRFSTPHPLMPDMQLFFAIDNTHVLKGTRELVRCRPVLGSQHPSMFPC